MTLAQRAMTLTERALAAKRQAEQLGEEVAAARERKGADLEACLTGIAIAWLVEKLELDHEPELLSVEFDRPGEKAKAKAEARLRAEGLTFCVVAHDNRPDVLLYLCYLQPCSHAGCPEVEEVSLYGSGEDPLAVLGWALASGWRCNTHDAGF